MASDPLSRHYESLTAHERFVLLVEARGRRASGAFAPSTSMSSTLASMGSALPYGLAAKLADPSRPVVALESSVLAQGLPIPANREADRRMTAAIVAAADDRGRWAILGMRIGTYSFRVEAPGFGGQNALSDPGMAMMMEAAAKNKGGTFGRGAQTSLGEDVSSVSFSASVACGEPL